MHFGFRLRSGAGARTCGSRYCAGAGAGDIAVAGDGFDARRRILGCQVPRFTVSHIAYSTWFRRKNNILSRAGRDTTACTLSFAIAEFMQHPEVAARLVAEVCGRPRGCTCFARWFNALRRAACAVCLLRLRVDVVDAIAG